MDFLLLEIAIIYGFVLLVTGLFIFLSIFLFKKLKGLIRVVVIYTMFILGLILAIIWLNIIVYTTQYREPVLIDFFDTTNPALRNTKSANLKGEHKELYEIGETVIYKNSSITINKIDRKVLADSKIKNTNKNHCLVYLEYENIYDGAFSKNRTEEINTSRFKLRIFNPEIGFDYFKSIDTYTGGGDKPSFNEGIKELDLEGYELLDISFPAPGVKTSFEVQPQQKRKLLLAFTCPKYLAESDYGLELWMRDKPYHPQNREYVRWKM